MTRYTISNSSISFYVECDEKGIITDCSNTPNNRPHWLIGKQIEWVKDYYDAGNTPMDYSVREAI